MLCAWLLTCVPPLSPWYADFGTCASLAARTDLKCNIELKWRKQLDASARAQAILELLGASAVGRFPVLQILTNGRKHQVMSLQGAAQEGKLVLVVWEQVTWAQCLAKMAQHLNARLPDIDTCLAPDGSFLPSVPLESQLKFAGLKRMRPCAGHMALGGWQGEEEEVSEEEEAAQHMMMPGALSMAMLGRTEDWVCRHSNMYS